MSKYLYIQETLYNYVIRGSISKMLVTEFYNKHKREPSVERISRKPFTGSIVLKRKYAAGYTQGYDTLYSVLLQPNKDLQLDREVLTTIDNVGLMSLIFDNMKTGLHQINPDELLLSGNFDWETSGKIRLITT